MAIYQYLDCNITLITPGDLDLIETSEFSQGSILISDKTPCGYWVYVPRVYIDPDKDRPEFEKHVAELKSEGFSANFVRIVRFAYDSDCGWIKLDVGGDLLLGFDIVGDKDAQEMTNDASRGWLK